MTFLRVLAALALALACGCASAESVQRATGTPQPGLAAQSAAASTSPAPFGTKRVSGPPVTTTATNSQLRMTDLDSWHVEGSVTLPGKIFGDQAVWAGGVRQREMNRVYLRDLTQHRTRILATAQKGWRTDWVKASTQFVLYMEAEGDSPDFDVYSSWRMHALELANGRNRVIASSRRGHGELPPSPVVEGHDAVWVQGSSRAARVLVADLRQTTPAARVIARGAGIADLGVTDGRVVYLQDVGGRRNLYLVALDGSAAPQKITSTGRVNRANVSSGCVAYEEGPAGGDPVRQLVLALGKGARPLLITAAARAGEAPASNITPGDALVSWFGTAGTQVARVSTPSQPITLTDSPDIQIRLDWDGSRLLWGETVVDGAGLHNTLHVTAIDG